MFERFTDRARRVVVLAQEEARLLNHNYIGTEHILLGLIREGEGIAAAALDSLEISLEAVRMRVEFVIGHGGQAPSGHIPFTPRAKKVLEMSLREALELGHNYIGTEHILLGLLREGDGVAAQALVYLGADLARVRQQVVQLLSAYPGGSVPGTMTARATGPLGPGRVSRCAFCGRDRWDVERYVRSGETVVCEECVRAARAALEESGERETIMPARGYGDPPPGREDLVAIQAAFTDAQAGDAAAVEDGEQLMRYQEENKQRHPGVQAAFVVQRVRSVSDDRAEVRFLVDVHSMRLQIPMEGAVVKHGGRWQIARETFVAILRLGGANPPD